MKTYHNKVGINAIRHKRRGVVFFNCFNKSGVPRALKVISHGTLKIVGRHPFNHFNNKVVVGDKTFCNCTEG